MKYIRTKTSIINAFTTLNSKELFDYLKQFDNYKDDLINVSDNIEELIDEFVIYDNFYHSRMTPVAMHTKENQEIIKGYLKQNIACYGAIWTDKGLIFVAKMNEKGELELL